MAGNSFGEILRITTFGESHGKGVGVIVDGYPPRIDLAEDDFLQEMARRRPGGRSGDTPRKEEDKVEILSGVFEGLTTGAPIALLIKNKDANSKPYEILRQVFRPGHADYTYYKKYGHFDFRGGGRYSARETACRVAAGVLATKIIEPMGISVKAYTLEFGGVQAKNIDSNFIDNNSFFCPDPIAAEQMEVAVMKALKEKDSLGGIVEILISGCPAGLGEPVFDKLDADLAKAIMSIGAVKGVEIGAGFESARLKGSENNDPITPKGFRTNRAGGILGGISNGDIILVRAVVKPIPSIKQQQETIDRNGQPAKLKLDGRFDVSAIPRVIPVMEAMAKIVIADHYLRSKTIMHSYVDTDNSEISE